MKQFSGSTCNACLVLIWSGFMGEIQLRSVPTQIRPSPELNQKTSRRSFVFTIAGSSETGHFRCDCFDDQWKIVQVMHSCVFSLAKEEIHQVKQDLLRYLGRRKTCFIAMLR